MNRPAVRVVAFGGGKGLSILLRGLASLGPRVDATGVVAVTDDGGSTGVLRRTLGIPAVGDVRRCLSAVAADDDWARLLEHRFTEPSPLRGHAMGNLLLAALHERDGTLSRSLATASRLVNARCRLLPMTDAQAHLVARMRNGRTVRGQSTTAKRSGPIETISLDPNIVAPAAGVLDAIASAELIVLGPGSLFTSVLAATLAGGIVRALARSSALVVLVQNLTTQRGETDGFGLADHLGATQRHLRARVDLVLTHRWPAEPPVDAVTSGPTTTPQVAANIAVDGGRGRLHDSRRLAVALYRIARSHRERPPAPTGDTFAM